jgi:hypothetical protein
MPVQTQILTRRGTAASWTSTNPTLGAGEIGYETDTGRFKIGTGAAAWASLGYFNRDPLTTKGDLYTFSTTDDRLAVGANGETLVADSSTSTGLRYQGSQAAGKNYQINGGFDNWQRSTSSSTINAYATADRWYQAGLGTVTYSRDTDVPANQGFTYSAKWLTGAATSYGEWYSALESQDVNVLAGRAVTLSYWVKSSGAYSGTVTLELQLGNTANTLLGGTWTTSAVTSTVTPTATWTKYQATGTITAATVGLRVRQVLSAAQASGIGLFITGIQIELGSVATTFTRAGGTLQGELAACKRYFKTYRGDATYLFMQLPTGINLSTTRMIMSLPFDVSMRSVPTVTISNLKMGYTGGTITAAGINQMSNDNGSFSAAGLFFDVASGQTAGAAEFVYGNNSASAKLDLSSEL